MTEIYNTQKMGAKNEMISTENLQVVMKIRVLTVNRERWYLENKEKSPVLSLVVLMEQHSLKAVQQQLVLYF